MSHRGAENAAPKTCVVTALLGLTALLLLLASPPAEAEAAAAPAGRTVIIGIPGMMWNDISRKDTPALWGLLSQGAGAGLSVRTTRVNTCPTDGWLTLSAGQRSRLAHADCALPSNPVVSGQTSGGVAPPDGGALAPGWAAIKADNADTTYHSQVGLLGDAVHRAGGCTMAVGPGAVFGLADGAGKVDRYVASPDKVAAADWTRCPLAAVDVDDLFRAYLSAGVDKHGEQEPVAAAERTKAAAAADRRVAQVLSRLPSNTTVLVAGLSDIGTKPHLRIAIAKGSPYGRGFLTSSATRQHGMVTLTDTTATVLRLLGLPQPREAVGSPWRTEPSKADTAHRVEALKDQDVAAQAIRGIQGSFYWILIGSQLVLYALAAVALRRNGRDPAARTRILGATRVVALLGGAAPVASFLAGLVPWWQAPDPTPVLVVTVLAFSGALAALALGGPWRRSVIAPGLVITAVTVLVLAVDVITGSRLQLNSLMGYTALVAGRFYGFGNQAFSLFAVAAILTAGWLAEYALRTRPADRTGLLARLATPNAAAIAVVAVVGVVAIAVDGLPAWGADFGGVLAMVPSFAMLALLVTGHRVSLPKLGLFCVAGAAVVLFISYLNSRSANPTHLGRFWNDLVSGDAWGTVVRKFESMLGSLGYWPFTLALAAALGFLFFVLARPTVFTPKQHNPDRPPGWGASLLDQAYEHSVTMRPTLIAALAAGVIGTLVNDSGVVILSVAFSLATPLMLAASVRALELNGDPEDTTGPLRPESRSAAAG